MQDVQLMELGKCQQPLPRVPVQVLLLPPLPLLQVGGRGCCCGCALLGLRNHVRRVTMPAAEQR